MKISIEKPKENKWTFPCLGKLDTGIIVYFSDWEMGVVVESDDDYKIGYTSAIWDMDKFTPIDVNGNKLNTKPKPIDWDKVEFPIWFKHSSGSISMITQKDVFFLNGTELYEDGVITWASQFDNVEERDKLLNSLEILPKGTKITIEL